MPKEFRVVDCRTTLVEPTQVTIVADTPEHAARLAFGEELVRGNRKPGALRARVYFVGAEGKLTMVRLYSKPEPQAAFSMTD